MYLPWASASATCVSDQSGVPPSCSANSEKVTDIGPPTGFPRESLTMLLKLTNRGTVVPADCEAAGGAGCICAGSCAKATAQRPRKKPLTTTPAAGFLVISSP